MTPLSRIRVCLLATVLAMLWLCPTGSAQDTLEIQVASATKRVYPALLYIEPVSEDFSGGRREKRITSGSGVIVSEDGLALTNYHVAGEARFLRCTLSNKEEVNATLVGGDPSTDVAVIRLDAEQFKKARSKDFAPAPLGDSTAIRVGQHVLAMGSPFGYDRSVSLGIVSCADRFLGNGARLPSGESTGSYNTWIQTDAAINPGNSGGPLVDLQGRVIGLNARVVAFGNSIGFAIPINQAKEVMDAILAHGRVRRSWLGLSLQHTKDLEPLLGPQEGVLISGVVADSPAATAGVEAGELLQAINGKALGARHESQLPEVLRLIARLPVNKEAILTLRPLMRGAAPRSVRVTTSEKDSLRGQVFEFPEWGMTVKVLNASMARQLKTPSRAGVLVFGVQPGSPAEGAGFMPNDVLVRMEARPIRHLDDFIRAVAFLRIRQPEKISTTVYRREALQYLLVEPRYEPGDTK